MRSGAQASGLADEGSVNFRSPLLLNFEERAGECGTESGHFLRLPPQCAGSECLVSLEVMRLHESFYSVLDGGCTLMLTQVLRHSPASLKWRNAWGEVVRLEPGAIFVNQGRKDSLVEVSPAPRHLFCNFVRVVFRTDCEGELAVRFEADEFLYCNSEAACVRLLLGAFGENVATFPGLPALNVLDIDIAPFREIAVPVARDHVALAVLTSGTLEVDGATLEPWAAVAFDGYEPLARLETQSGAAVLWFSFPRQFLEKTLDSF